MQSAGYKVQGAPAIVAFEEGAARGWQGGPRGHEGGVTLPYSLDSNHMRVLKLIPQNGHAFFCANISGS